jgi:hypothetical protein
MQELRISRRHVLKGAGAMGMLGALSIPAAVSADEDGDGRRIRWDILTPDAIITPGGHLSAKASDGSTITMTGSGTFQPGDPEEVTGGGTWSTAAGAVGSHSGTYRVKSLVTFTQAPGAIPPGTPDRIGNAADARAGFAVFRIAFSNGSNGLLCFSCMLPGSPESVLEGITASMGFVDFWNSVEAPQTIFHVLRRHS